MVARRREGRHLSRRKPKYIARCSYLGGSSDQGGICHARVFFGTIIGKLYAADADTGKLCEDFGSHGVINLRTVGLKRDATELGISSAPTVVGDVVIVGSTMPDNSRVSMPEGVVRGFDVHTGALLWSWDPIPWANAQQTPTGAANAWATISADLETGTIFVPTGSASPDFYGGMRVGDGRDANSVVALDAKTGKKIWAFQVVHHDLWDYDVPSEPVLFMLHGTIPAVAFTTKMGMLFVLDRRTGAPLYPVEERTVPQTDVPGEVTSPTQPFSTLPSFSPLEMPKTDATGWQRSPKNAQRCRELMAGMRYEGIYTPPSKQGTILFPGNIGGVNWGGAALDRNTNILYANSNRLPYAVTILDREDRFEAKELGILYFLVPRSHQIHWLFLILSILIIPAFFWKKKIAVAVGVADMIVFAILVTLHFHGQNAVEKTFKGAFEHDHSPMFQTPYELLRLPLKDYDGAPCISPPWGAIGAINLDTGKKEWDRPLGTSYPDAETGSVSLGGPLVTAGGLVFSAATRQPILRAFDAKTGELVWKTDLPVPAQSTPMSYVAGGKQFIVITDGGHGLFGTKTGDSVIAFGLE